MIKEERNPHKPNVLWKMRVEQQKYYLDLTRQEWQIVI